jgi:3-oxoacyl-[acyl-carrier protein] reductase
LAFDPRQKNSTLIAPFFSLLVGFSSRTRTSTKILTPKQDSQLLHCQGNSIAAQERSIDYLGWFLEEMRMDDLYVAPPLQPIPKGALADKIALVTGASRGIGAVTARVLAQAGAQVVLNYRNKGVRAEKVAAEIEAAGGKASTIQCDITVSPEVDSMLDQIRREFGFLNFLILNASGGLEKDKGKDYSMFLNCTAQVDLLKKVLPLLQPQGRAIFITSHLAHFYGQKPVYPGYEPVAIGKLAGEKELRAMIPQLATRKIALIVVSGDMIEGTITPKLLNRTNRGLIEFRREQAGRLPTVEEFGQAIAEAAADPNLQSGSTVYVGGTD